MPISFTRWYVQSIRWIMLRMNTILDWFVIFKTAQRYDGRWTWRSIFIEVASHAEVAAMNTKATATVWVCLRFMARHIIYLR